MYGDEQDRPELQGPTTADYLAALSGVNGWAIERDGRLRLDGTVPLRYTPH